MPERIAHTAFSPWAAWPTDIGAIYRTSNVGGAAFELAESDAGSFALWFATPPASPAEPFGLPLFAPNVAPETNYDPYPSSMDVTGSIPGGPPAFVARTTMGYMLGHGSAWSPSEHFVALRWLELPTGLGLMTTEYGCANARPAAGAAAPGDGSLVAVSGGKPFSSCYDDDSIPGPPTELQIFQFSVYEIALGTAIDGAEPIRRIRVTGRSDGGAWVVWQRAGSSATIQALHVDAAGQAVSEVVSIAGSGMAAGPFAASAMGNWVAVAWQDAADPAAPTLVVQVLDEAGKHAGSTSLSPPGWVTPGRLALLASPSCQQLLMAWSAEPEDTGAQPWRVFVARLDCTG